MSQIRLTAEERIEALKRLGYSEREAAFLAIAALHGGCFLRRQYAAFLAQQDGGSVAQLIDKVTSQGHVHVLTFFHKTNIYHLCTRPFYALLGQTDNRNRRQRQPLTIKNKLMGLDFVLAHRDYCYLATEQEKLDYFTAILGIPASELPTAIYRSAKTKEATARYFVDKYPIFLDAEPAGAPPVVSFCFVDEGLTTVSRFETYLAQYSRLLAALSQFRLVYVAATPVLFAAAKRSFDRFLAARRSGSDGSAIDPRIRRILEHFEARRQYESQQFSGFDRAKLIQFRNEREEFSGKETEALYARWKTDGERAVIAILAPEIKTAGPIHGTFSAYLLEHHYDLFGSLTA